METDGGATTGNEGSSRSRLVRSLVLAGAVAAAAYLARRRLRRAPAPPVEAVRETADDLVPEGVRERAEEAVPIDGREIPIGEPSAESTDGAEGTDAVEDVVEGASDRIREAEVSSEEIAERASDAVQADPAEPGEMTIDEDLADDLVDEVEGDGTESETEGDGAESETEGDGAESDEAGDGAESDEAGDGDREDDEA